MTNLQQLIMRLDGIRAWSEEIVLAGPFKANPAGSAGSNWAVRINPDKRQTITSCSAVFEEVERIRRDMPIVDWDE